MSIRCQYKEFSFSEKTNEKLQSPATDQSMAKQGRDTEHRQPHDSKNTIQSKTTSSLFLIKMIAKLERTL